jgi:hypothetical protein
MGCGTEVRSTQEMRRYPTRCSGGRALGVAPSAPLGRELRNHVLLLASELSGLLVVNPRHGEAAEGVAPEAQQHDGVGRDAPQGRGVGSGRSAGFRTGCRVSTSF